MRGEGGRALVRIAPFGTTRVVVKNQWNDVALQKSAHYLPMSLGYVIFLSTSAGMKECGEKITQISKSPVFFSTLSIFFQRLRFGVRNET
jgi:hypothetical protein